MIVFVLELSVFIVVWLALLFAIFTAIVYALFLLFPRSTNGMTRRLIALCVASSVLFQLVKMYRDLQSIRATTIMQGPPLACQGGLGQLIGLFSMSCHDYYKSIDRNVFWELNVFRVVFELVFDLMVTSADAFGRTGGRFVSSLLNELPWLYQIPTLIFMGACVFATIFAWFGYRFRLFYGIFQLDQSCLRQSMNGQNGTISGDETARKSRENLPLPVKQATISPEMRQVSLLKELYLK